MIGAIMDPVAASPEWILEHSAGMRVRWRVSRGTYRCEGCEEPLAPGVRVAMVGRMVDDAEERREGAGRVVRTRLVNYFQRFARLCVDCGEVLERKLTTREVVDG